jgi:hypothetical protein
MTSAKLRVLVLLFLGAFVCALPGHADSSVGGTEKTKIGKLMDGIAASGLLNKCDARMVLEGLCAEVPSSAFTVT